MAAPLGLPGDQPARLPGELARLLGGDRLRQRRRRDLEGRELLDQPPDPLRVGLLVDPVERRHAAALEQLRDTLVGEDHQLLDQPVGLGLRRPSGRRVTWPSSKRNSGSKLSTSSEERGRRPASAAAA